MVWGDIMVRVSRVILTYKRICVISRAIGLACQPGVAKKQQNPIGICKLLCNYVILA